MCSLHDDGWCAATHNRWSLGAHCLCAVDARGNSRSLSAAAYLQQPIRSLSSPAYPHQPIPTSLSPTGYPQASPAPNLAWIVGRRRPYVVPTYPTYRPTFGIPDPKYSTSSAEKLSNPANVHTLLALSCALGALGSIFTGPSSCGSALRILRESAELTTGDGLDSPQVSPSKI